MIGDWMMDDPKVGDAEPLVGKTTLDCVQQSKLDLFLMVVWCESECCLEKLVAVKGAGMMDCDDAGCPRQTC